MVSSARPPERLLPANPNCVSFAARAEDLLEGRTWAELQRFAIRAATPFHEASGLAVLVGVGWRVALDRRNQRHRQVTVYFVFDGPSTASHLDQLDDAMGAEAVGFGTGSIERVPATGVPAALLADGRACLVLDDTADDPGIGFRKLVLEDGRINAVRVALAHATEADRADELELVLGVPAPYRDEDREVERMRLAFAHYFSTRIMEADGIVREGEQQFMSNVFPPELISRLGLQDDKSQAEYLEAARTDLAGRLGHHDKLGLIGLFFSACYADGSLDAREMRVLKEAGDWLGLPREAVVKYLRRFW